MSEDVDFKVELIGTQSLSRSAMRTQLGILRDRVSAALTEEGFSLDPSTPRIRNENRYMRYQLPYEGTDPEVAGLRPTIQVELTYAPLRLDVVRLPVASFIAEAFQRHPEIADMACVAVTETAAEKLISLTRRTAMQIAGLSRDDDTTLVRHLYDLHVLRSCYDVSEVSTLASTIMLNDAVTFANQYPAYREQPLAEARKALEALKGERVHSERFMAFQRDMVYGEKIDFSAALETVEGLVERLEQG
jgi:GR25 family glycosyltransferase involved in LPS biosynthesis